ncbi:MAG TPA: hypothetical protein DCW90_23835, partial [Lachnospiraceae bacterium]|nr:hypothetical protein [Lachnospiraceae bacterium]
MANYLKANDGGDLLNADQFFYTEDDIGRPVLNVAGAAGVAPVLKVNGKIGNVLLTTDDIPDGINTKQLTNELRQKILDNEAHITVLDAEVGDNKRDICTNTANITRVETALQSKQDLVVGAASTAVEDNFTPDKIIITNAAGKLATSAHGEEVFMPNGGAQGQILVKNTANDYDVKWVDPAQAQAEVTSVNTKKGDVVLTQDDVGNGQTFVQTHNDYTDADKQQVEANTNDLTTIKQQITTINTKLNRKVDRTGDTMTGALTLANDPTTDMMAATKKYVDEHAGGGANLPAHTEADENKVLSVSHDNAEVWRTVSEVPVSTNADVNKVLTVGVNGQAQWLNVPPSQNGIPNGGTQGQMLIKNSNTDYDVVWQNVAVPPTPTLADAGKALVAQNDGTLTYKNIEGTLRDGGNENEVLIKRSNTDYDTEWVSYLPKGGMDGYILVKDTNNIDYATRWENLNSRMIPKGGNTANVLAKNSNNDYATVWTDISKQLIPKGGTEGQALVKTNAADYSTQWKTVNSVPESTTADAGKVLAVNNKGVAEWQSSSTKNVTMEPATTSISPLPGVIAAEPENTVGFMRTAYTSAISRQNSGFAMYSNWGLEGRINYYDYYNFNRGAIYWCDQESDSLHREGYSVTIS